MIADISFECYTNEFNFYKLNLIIPLLFVWIGFITGLILLKLYKSRKYLSNNNIRLNFGFIIQDYKTRIYYWEFIKIMEKILVIIIINIYS